MKSLDELKAIVATEIKQKGAVSAQYVLELMGHIQALENTVHNLRRQLQEANASKE